MATCRKCIHWEKCSKADGTTQFYGKEMACNNVEELCVGFTPTKTETEIEFLLREGKRRNEIPIAKDITVKAKVKRYRKKPVVVEAYKTDKELIIHTLEGDMKANVGDYIITGVKGEQYPCKPDIFEATYELADTTANVAPIADTVRKMHFEIEQRCIKGGIYPVFVACTVNQVAYEMTGDDLFKPRFMLDDKDER